MIARAGKDLGSVETKQQMHAVLGEPAVKGVEERGPYEEFRTREVIAEDWSVKGEGYAMLLGTTCGAVELVAVPYQLYLLGKRSLLGQTVRVTYGQDGAIIGVERDGESVIGLFRPRRHREAQATDDSQPTAPMMSGASE
jgi:hypothetical protein